MIKRKSPIATSFIKNSIAAMFSSIEIHNKPTIKYRYEIVIILIINAWELLLKGYLYKYHKTVKIFQKDGSTKPFENCLNIVNQKIGKEFNPIQENISVLYYYRNQIAHCYISDIDIIVYSLIRKSIIFYSHFVHKYFNIDLSETSDLILLPIGFKKPISPLDYISNKSVNKSSSKEVRKFLDLIVESSKRLSNNNIDETIFVDFKMNLTNVNQIRNADIVAGVDNTKENDLIFTVSKKQRNIISSHEGEKVILTRNKSESQGILYYESLQEGIFDEINNIVDANHLLSKGNSKFMLGQPMYYRIYAERQFVNFNLNRFELFAKTGMMEFYAPYLYWLTKLPERTIAEILFDNYFQCKSPRINNLNKIIILLGGDAIDVFNDLFEKKYKNQIQKPNHYYTFHSLIKSKKSHPILKALNVTKNKKIDIKSENGDFSFGDLIVDRIFTINKLSTASLDVYNGEVELRSVARDLDYIAYGEELIIRKDDINREIVNISSSLK